jgi:hypothetical protein
MAYGAETYALMLRRRKLRRELNRQARLVEELRRLVHHAELGTWLAAQLARTEQAIHDTYTRRRPRNLSTAPVVAVRSVRELLQLARTGRDTPVVPVESETGSVRPPRSFGGSNGSETQPAH